MNILVLCTGNSARSILLESILNTLGKGRVAAWSAGSKPTGTVHSQSLRLLTQMGHDVSSVRSKSWDEFAATDAPEMDLVITVCGSAANETCPVWPGAPLRSHWGVEDPAAAEPDELPAAFQSAYDCLHRRAEALLALPLEKLSQGELKAATAQIGELS